jgi:hypothetical protein
MLQGALRFVWIPLATSIVATGAAAAWSSQLSNRYRSEFVTQVTAPDALRGLDSRAAENRRRLIEAVDQTLQRVELERIANDLSQAGAPLTGAADPAATLITDIDVAPGESGRIVVGYTSANRDRTRLVTARLADLFATAPERERARRREAQIALDGEMREMGIRLERAKQILDAVPQQSGALEDHALPAPTAASAPAAAAAAPATALPAGGRAVLETEAKRLQGQYDELASKRAALDAVPPSGLTFEILAPPDGPRRPWDATVWRLLALSGAAGLLLGAAVTGVIRSRGVRLRSPEDVRVAIGIPVLAVVPEMSAGRAITTGKRMSVVALAVAGLAAASVWWWSRLY